MDIIGKIISDAIAITINAAVAAEREACAKIAETTIKGGLSGGEEYPGRIGSKEIAAAIRERGEH